MADACSLLIVFSGLPGTGKTTVARAAAAKLGATFLRVDSIEQAILGAHTGCEIGAAGYAVANAVAEANLSLGMSVVADCVNPVEESREAWRMTAKRASARIIEVEIVCSDQAEHQRRVQTRQADIPGHLLPSWDEVIQLYYEPWTRARLTVDTSCLAPLEAVDLIVGATR